MLTFDRRPLESVRTVDEYGRLHVAVSNISKATVNEYRGDEIPGWESMGLDGSRFYKMLRDPRELEKAAATFNAVPLLSAHVAVHAESPQKEIVVGATGGDAEFASPYLRNSLVVWDAESIRAIDSGEQREISCAYRYDPVMEPGEYEGMKYDGRMVNIIANHVALVREGRAGPDVVVGDEKPMEHSKMKMSRKAHEVKGALAAFIAPKLAADAKVDLTKAVAAMTAKGFKSQTAGVAKAVHASLTGNIASDCGVAVEDIVKVIEALSPTEGEVAAEVTDEDPPRDVDAVIAALRSELGDEGFAELCRKLSDDEDMDPRDEDGIEVDKAKDEKEADKVDKEAMDAAIKAAVKIATDSATQAAIRTQREIRAAESDVRPFVGELNGAFDSAPDVYRAALGLMGVDVSAVKDPAALRIILKSQKVPSSKPAAIAADAKAVSSFNDFYGLRG